MPLSVSAALTAGNVAGNAGSMFAEAFSVSNDSVLTGVNSSGESWVMLDGSPGVRIGVGCVV